MLRLNLVPSLNFLFMCSLLFLDSSFGIQKVLWFCPGACNPVSYLTFQQFVCFECPTLTLPIISIAVNGLASFSPFTFLPLLISTILHALSQHSRSMPYTSVLIPTFPF